MVNEQIVNEFMACVKWNAGIEYVSGALSKGGNKGHHNHSKMLLATHRVAATTTPNCNNIYLRDMVKRTTPVTPDEIVKRTRFAEVARAVNTRAHDLMKMTQDQAAFLAQKDQPNGKKTMKAYLWSLEMAAYDASHNG